MDGNTGLDTLARTLQETMVKLIESLTTTLVQIDMRLSRLEAETRDLNTEASRERAALRHALIDIMGEIRRHTDLLESIIQYHKSDVLMKLNKPRE